jgi:hypothetical protein
MLNRISKMIICNKLMLEQKNVVFVRGCKEKNRIEAFSFSSIFFECTYALY